MKKFGGFFCSFFIFLCFNILVICSYSVAVVPTGEINLKPLRRVLDAPLS